MNPSGWHLEESILGDLQGPLPPAPPPPQDLLFPLTASLPAAAAAEAWLAAAPPPVEGAENCRMKPVTLFLIDGIASDGRTEDPT